MSRKKDDIKGMNLRILCVTLRGILSYRVLGDRLSLHDFCRTFSTFSQ